MTTIQPTHKLNFKHIGYHFWSENWQNILIKAWSLVKPINHLKNYQPSAEEYTISCINYFIFINPFVRLVTRIMDTEREREMFYLTTHSTHFIYGYMASDIWLRTILIVRKETCYRHIGYSYWVTARVLLYAPSHRQDNTYHSLCYTSRGALAGTNYGYYKITVITGLSQIGCWSF